MTYEIVPDFKTLLNLTKAVVKGYVVYDVDTPGSQFIAATICGLNNSIAISSYMIPMMEEIGIPRDIDLRGILRGLYLTQVYDWGYNNLWSKCSRDVIGNMIHGTDWIKLDLTSYFQNSSSVYIKFEDSDTPDGNGAQLAGAVLDVLGNGSTWILPRHSATEAPFLYEQKGSWLNAESHRVAGWDQYWIYKIPPTPGVSANLTLELYGQYKVSIATDPANEWTNVAYYRFKCDDPFAGDFYTQIIDYLVSKKAFVMSLSSSEQPDYSVKQKFLSEMNSVGLVIGWFGPYDTEAAHIGHLSANGLTALCGFPQSPNFSLHSKIQPTVTFDQNFPDPRNVMLENKVYITFVFSDGDALWSNNNFHYRNWLTDERGQIPLGWEMSLALLDLAPGMVQYYYETCTPNDEIVASVSGYGYFLPNLTPTQDVRLNLEKANLYMKTLDIKELYIMVDGKSSNATRQLYGSIMNNSDMFFEGFAAAPGTMPQITLAQDTPWTWTSYPVRTLDFSEKSAQQLADDLAAVANASGNAPCFIAVHVMPFDYMVPKLVEISHLLNSTHFEVVTPNKFAVLAQQALTQQNQTAPAGTLQIAQHSLPLSLIALQVVSCLNISGEFNILQILPRRLKRDASS